MTKEEATMVAFEIVAYSGDARSKLLMAVEKAKAGDLVTADRLVAEANECLVDAHKAQTDLLQQEARGDNVEVGFIMVLEYLKDQFNEVDVDGIKDYQALYISYHHLFVLFHQELSFVCMLQIHY